MHGACVATATYVTTELNASVSPSSRYVLRSTRLISIALTTEPPVVLKSAIASSKIWHRAIV
jgi:hypothetical protein